MTRAFLLFLVSSIPSLAFAQDSEPGGFEIVYRNSISHSDAMSLGLATPILWGSSRFGLEAGKRYYEDSQDDGSKYAIASGTDFGAFLSTTTPLNEMLSIPVVLHIDYNTYRKQKATGSGTEGGGHVSFDLDAGIRIRGSRETSFFADLGWVFRSSFLPEKKVIVGDTILRNTEPGVYLKIGYTFL